MPTAVARKRACRVAAKRKNANWASKPTGPPPRRSARLQKIESALAAKGNESHQLPSPSASPSPKPARGKKRKQIASSQEPSKRARIVSRTGTSLDDYEEQPILYWIKNEHWPTEFRKEGPRMSELPSHESSKRRTSSLHRSELKRQRAEQGVFMRQSPHLSEESKALCENLVAGEYELVPCILYPESALPEVLEHVQGLNETRIQRDVMPRVVPPAEILRFQGQPILPWVCEDLNALWCYCKPKGGSVPKPDYTVGLSQDAFSKDEVLALKNTSTPERPFMFTPDVCFPFLTCEAKSGDQAMSRAQTQNMGSGSVAVGAIIELYKAAFGRSDPHRIEELYGKVLAFSVSHDHDNVTLWGHYAVKQPTDNKDQFYYHALDAFSLSVGNGRNKNKAYNFVRGVYEKFAPEHRNRIKEAAANLLKPKPRTERSFAASDLGLYDADSQPDSRQASQEEGYRIPGQPASAINEKGQQEQIDRLLQQLEQQRQDSKEKEARMERQMEEQREQTQQLLQQLEQQRQDSKEKEVRMERQMEQMMSLLKQPSR